MSVVLRAVVLTGFALSISAAPYTPAQVRSAAAKSIALIQKSVAGWYSKQSCESCHHQTLPPMALRAARDHGLAVDEELAADSARRSFAFMADLDRAVQATHILDPAIGVSARLVAAADSGVVPNITAAAYVRHVASRQLPDGHWPTADNRPPQAYSPFTATALTVRAIQLYSSPRQSTDMRQRVAKAALWLSRTAASNTEERTMQLLGLTWAGAPPQTIRELAEKLLVTQKTSGGWSELPYLEAEAYSTGEALVALSTSGVLKPEAEAYERAVAFLLQAQRPDGSWFVPSRLHPPAPVSPPYFEAGFPYGHDQFISIMGTTWAVTALAETLPRVDAKTGPVSLNVPDPAPWIQAALFGTADELGEMLDNGLDPNRATPDGTSLLMLAGPDIAKVRLLVDRGADVNATAKTGYTALLTAASYGGARETVRYLLEHGARLKPEKRPIFNASALTNAIPAGDLELIRLLLNAGASPTQSVIAAGTVSMRPADIAQTYAASEILAVLLKAGADANSHDPSGLSLLSWAVIKNDPATVEVLLRAGARVNEVDKLGMTPLLYGAALDFDDTKVVELLLRNGADPAVRDPNGLSVRELARKYHHVLIGDVLRRSRIATHY